MIIPLLCLVTATLAEPPVGDSYSPLRSHNQDHFSQRSLSQSYIPPPFGTRNSLSTEYGPPSSRGSQKFGQRSSTSSVSRSYGPPGRSQGSAKSISQEYGVPNYRGISQDYGLPNARNGISQEYGVPNARNGISQEYGAPNARGISQEYGAPDARSISEEYGAPDVRNSISQEYGLPDAGTEVSQQYGVPDARSISQEYGAPNARTISEQYGPPGGYSGSARTLSTDYGVPDARSTPSKDYGTPELAKSNQKSSHRSHQGFSQSKSASFGSRIQPQKSPFRSSSYPASLRNSDSYSQNHNTVSPTHLPSQRDLSDTYGVPNARGISQEYGTPASRVGLNTNAIASSYAAPSARTSPSSTYGVPSARMPSDKYGVPDQLALSREALEQLLNNEPANYDFAYKVNDYESGSDFGHKESRQENRAEGSYFVVLPDGTKQTVEYEADERGFKPRISVEQVDVSARSGYDDNASDLTRSGYDHASDLTRTGYDHGSDLTRSGYDHGSDLTRSGYDHGSDLTQSGYDDNASDLAHSDDGPY